MSTARMRSVGPEVTIAAGRRIALLRGGVSYPDLHDMIMEATRDDKYGPTSISAATLRSFEKPTWRDGEQRVRRLEVGEVRAISLTFNVSTDYILDLTDRKYPVWGG